MMSLPTPWRKPGGSKYGPEVRLCGDGHVEVRNSRYPDDVFVAFDQREWSAFAEAVKAGALDDLIPAADRCRSHSPGLHPAVQAGGEVQPCPDPWHTPIPGHVRGCLNPWEKYHSRCPVAPPADDAQPSRREVLGQLVRETWVSWAAEQPDPKPSWLAGWDDLDHGQREVDMRIGEAVAAAARSETWSAWIVHNPAGTPAAVFASEEAAREWISENPRAHPDSALTSWFVHGAPSNAAAVFVETWAELLTGLPDNYSCSLTCAEAEAAADLLREFGYHMEAQQLTEAHAASDDPGDSHYRGQQ